MSASTNSTTQPQHLLVDGFEVARNGQSLSGEVSLKDLPRLRDVLADRSAAPMLTWLLDGVLRERAGSPPQPLLHLTVRGAVPLTCQRCLQTVEQPVNEDVVFRLEHDDTEPTQAELEEDEEVLPLSGPLNVRDLVEDQVLLALPIVPMHTVCPQPLAVADEPGPEQGDRVQPFADLRRLLDAAKSSNNKH